jgi:hypothetical protein
LSDSERKKRNIKNKINLQIHRQKKRLEEQERNQIEESAAETSGYESVDPLNSNLLQVALPFPNRRRGSQKRKSNEMSRMRKQIASLKSEVSTVKRKLGTAQRRNQRLIKRLDFRPKLQIPSTYKSKKNQEVTKKPCIQSEPDRALMGYLDEAEQEAAGETIKVQTPRKSPNVTEERIVKETDMTPKARAESIMQSAKLTSEQRNAVRKDLILSGAMAKQLKQKSQGHSKGTVKNIHSIISGAIIRKYSIAKEICSRTGLNRNTMSRYMHGKQKSKLC